MERKIDKIKETAFFAVLLRNLPFILTVLAIVIEVAPVRFSYFSFVRPKLSLIFVFLTSVYFSETSGYFRMFLLGLFADLFGYSILGVNAFLFLATYTIVSKYSNYLANRSFVFVYVVFLLTVLVNSFAEIMIISIWQHTFSPFGQVMISYLLAVSVYPFVVKIFYLIEKNTNVE